MDARSLKNSAFLLPGNINQRGNAQYAPAAGHYLLVIASFVPRGTRAARRRAVDHIAGALIAGYHPQPSPPRSAFASHSDVFSRLAFRPPGRAQPDRTMRSVIGWVSDRQAAVNSTASCLSIIRRVKPVWCCGYAAMPFTVAG